MSTIIVEFRVRLRKKKIVSRRTLLRWYYYLHLMSLPKQNFFLKDKNFLLDLLRFVYSFSYTHMVKVLFSLIGRALKLESRITRVFFFKDFFLKKAAWKNNVILQSTELYVYIIISLTLYELSHLFFFNLFIFTPKKSKVNDLL